MVRSLLANVWDGVNEMIDDTQHENLYGSYEWKHPTQVAGVPWKNPVATASGTFQYAAVRWFYDVSQLGAVTTKGVSPVPWEGNPGIRTAEGPSSNINAVGLQNPGVDHYLEDDLPKLKAINATVIANGRSLRRRLCRSRVQAERFSGRHAGNQRELPERVRRRYERRH